MQVYDSTQAARFTQLLTQREAELRAILAATGDLADAAPNMTQREVVDFKDLAIEETQAVVDEAKAEHAGVELQQILAARHRLADHTYGQCLDCGDAIDLRRLTALPATAFCTACQSIHEQEHLAATRR